MAIETGQKRGIEVCFDMDGTLVTAWFSSPKTAWRLIRRNLQLPPENDSVGIYTDQDPFYERSLTALLYEVHRWRKVNPEAVEQIRIMRGVAESADRDVRFHILTGREPLKHGLTIASLEQAQALGLFDSVIQNPGTNSARSKELKVKEFVEEGKLVLHAEDDLRTALSLDRINNQFPGDPRVFVYLVKTVWNHPGLRKWAGVDLPPTIIPISSFSEMTTDFRRRLSF